MGEMKPFREALLKKIPLDKCCIKRMTTFIKTKFNKSDDQTNIDNIE